MKHFVQQYVRHMHDFGFYSLKVGGGGGGGWPPHAYDYSMYFLMVPFS